MIADAMEFVDRWGLVMYACVSVVAIVYNSHRITVVETKLQEDIQCHER